MKIELEKYGIQMPAFSKIGGILANELSVDEAACKKRGILWVQMGLLLLLLMINTKKKKKKMINTIMMVLDIRNFASKFRSVDIDLNTTIQLSMLLLFGNKWVTLIKIKALESEFYISVPFGVSYFLMVFTWWLRWTFP